MPVKIPPQPNSVTFYLTVLVDSARVHMESAAKGTSSNGQMEENPTTQALEFLIFPF
jgi:hypothetical protein